MEQRAVTAQFLSHKRPLILWALLFGCTLYSEAVHRRLRVTQAALKERRKKRERVFFLCCSQRTETGRQNEGRDHGNHNNDVCQGRISHSVSLCGPGLVSGWLFAQTSTLLRVSRRLFLGSSSSELPRKTNTHYRICIFNAESRHPPSPPPVRLPLVCFVFAQQLICNPVRNYTVTFGKRSHCMTSFLYLCCLCV